MGEKLSRMPGWGEESNPTVGEWVPKSADSRDFNVSSQERECQGLTFAFLRVLGTGIGNTQYWQSDTRNRPVQRVSTVSYRIPSFFASANCPSIRLESQSFCPRFRFVCFTLAPSGNAVLPQGWVARWKAKGPGGLYQRRAMWWACRQIMRSVVVSCRGRLVRYCCSLTRSQQSTGTQQLIVR